MANTEFVTASLDPETATKLDQMAADAGYDNRSAFVRWLIRQEWSRRHVDTRISDTTEQPQPEQG